jgi:predicted membrane protein
MSAKVNLTTGKIIGCKKDSFAWWHEKGHIEYDNSEEGITNTYKQQMYFYWAITFLIPAIFISTFAFASIIFICLFWYYFWYEESWCNKYARERYIKTENNKKGDKQ